MSSAGTPTLHLGLNQWLPNDKPERVDFNSDNKKIDAFFNSKANLTSANFTVLKRGGYGVWDAGNLPVETGTFTPYLYGETASGTITYTHQLGWYYRIGKYIGIWIRFRVASIITAPSGGLSIRGLPFVVSATGYANVLNLSHTTVLSDRSYVTQGMIYDASRIILSKGSRWDNLVLGNNLTSNWELNGSGFYLTT